MGAKWRRKRKPEPVEKEIVEPEPCCCGVKGCDGTGPWPSSSQKAVRGNLQ